MEVNWETEVSSARGLRDAQCRIDETADEKGARVEQGWSDVSWEELLITGFRLPRD